MNFLYALIYSLNLIVIVFGVSLITMLLAVLCYAHPAIGIPIAVAIWFGLAWYVDSTDL